MISPSDRSIRRAAIVELIFYPWRGLAQLIQPEPVSCIRVVAQNVVKVDIEVVECIPNDEARANAY